MPPDWRRSSGNFHWRSQRLPITAARAYEMPNRERRQLAGFLNDSIRNAQPGAPAACRLLERFDTKCSTGSAGSLPASSAIRYEMLNRERRQLAGFFSDSIRNAQPGAPAACRLLERFDTKCSTGSAGSLPASSAIRYEMLNRERRQLAGFFSDSIRNAQPGAPAACRLLQRFDTKCSTGSAGSLPASSPIRYEMLYRERRQLAGFFTDSIRNALPGAPAACRLLQRFDTKCSTGSAGSLPAS